jgi:aminopeptidase N
VHDVWDGTATVAGLTLSEDDLTELAETLAIRLPGRAEAIVERQLQRIENPDNRRRFEFVAPSLSADRAVRDAFFESLRDARNRETESWVVDALENLHHPSRIHESEAYIRPSLELLQEIQVTGDIFFPTQWLVATLENHRSSSAVATVRGFLDERPDYNPQLRMKILQAADLLFRAEAQSRRR